ncbi:monovalent cation/H(+) antiporter subunit G [Jeotgalibacillus soli]|uniref:Cation:proton antiporter n=1 Tax=Jeotgalibacillus soli TaxID=889306 RepID=A0A0C2VF26_9BACL|nr:monovalent cation/H(+) antiporter subunit G [Jeotgalibacillus soli]KIL42603.1 cation:proton antiporter [Jeotgalibacillus soli]
MIEMSSFFIAFFVIVGAFLSVVTALGLIRLPDVYTRTHAASKSATLGVMSVLIGIMIFFWTQGGFNSYFVLGIFFILITAPVGGHLLTRASYNSGVKLWEGSVQDDLAMDKQTQEQIATKNEET